MEQFEQHPIPQQISSYQFRLVGDMTLKQFFQVAGGVIISLILYSSGLNPIIKWPLIVISFLFGIALAFFPLEDRPLEKWIVLFIKSIYSPTKFVWNSSVTKREYFLKEAELNINPPTNLASVAATQIPQATVQTAQSTPASTMPQTPPVKTDEVQIPKSEMTPITEEEKESMSALTHLEQAEKAFLSRLTEHFQTSQNTPIQNVSVINTITVDKPKIMSPTQTSPQQKVDTVSAEELSAVIVPVRSAQPMPTTNPTLADIQNEVTPPVPATRANLVVGQVLDTNDRIIEGAILEIRDQTGRPARALRTNRLGHFSIVTPLSEGSYQIYTEADGYIFDVTSFNVNNEIIPTLTIKAKEQITNQVSTVGQNIYQSGNAQ